MKILRAGDLRHKIIIQREQMSQSDIGEVVKQWVNIKVTRAKVNPLSGDEGYSNQSITNDVDHEIILRYTDLQPADRIIFVGRVFDVKRVLDFEQRRKYLLVLATERLNEKYVIQEQQRVIESGDSRVDENNNFRVTEG